MVIVPVRRSSVVMVPVRICWALAVDMRTGMAVAPARKNVAVLIAVSRFRIRTTRDGGRVWFPAAEQKEAARRVPLFHFLLDGAAERKQLLVDRGRHLADEFHHLPAVLEDSGLPDELIAEFVDPGLVGRRRALERLQRKRVGADLLGGLALLARHALEPVH